MARTYNWVAATQGPTKRPSLRAAPRGRTGGRLGVLPTRRSLSAAPRGRTGGRL